jgi:hypothetical protein
VTQRSLFDRPVARVTSARALRDVACEQVLANAGQKWQTDARSILLQMPSELTGEDIRLACEDKGIKPHNNNAWGSFVLSLIKQGYLEPTGRYVAMRSDVSHARKTQVYRRIR